MLGLADRGRVLDLFDMVMKGDAAAALAELSAQYADGVDPMAVLRDLAEITHWTSVIKITPEAADDPTVSPDERARGTDMAGRLPMRALTRMWQMLLKSLEEVAVAPNSMMAAEMAIIRLTYVAELPSPEDLVRKLQDAPRHQPPVGGGSGGGVGARGKARNPADSGAVSGASVAPQGSGVSAIAGGGVTANAQAAPNQALARFQSFELVVDLIRANRDVKLLVEVEDGLRLAKYSPGRIEFEMTEHAPRDLASRLAARLKGWTGARWVVSVVGDGGGETIAERRDAVRSDLHAQALEHPMVQAVLTQFPGAEIREVKAQEFEPMDNVVPIDPDDVDDDWDPFEDD